MSTPARQLTLLEQVVLNLATEPFRDPTPHLIARRAAARTALTALLLVAALSTDGLLALALAAVVLWRGTGLLALGLASQALAERQARLGWLTPGTRLMLADREAFVGGRPTR